MSFSEGPFDGPITSVASTAALSSIETASLVDGDFAYVTGAGQYYTLSKSSSATTGSSVFPTKNSSGGTRPGRWALFSPSSVTAYVVVRSSEELSCPEDVTTVVLTLPSLTATASGVIDVAATVSFSADGDTAIGVVGFYTLNGVPTGFITPLSVGSVLTNDAITLPFLGVIESVTAGQVYVISILATAQDADVTASTRIVRAMFVPT